MIRSEGSIKLPRAGEEVRVGATSVALYYEGRLPIDRYMQAIDDEKINTLCMPPTAWRLARASVNMSQYKFEYLREIVAAGEPLNPEIYH